MTILRIQSYKGFDCEIKVWTKNVPNFEFTVNALTNLNSFYHYDFEIKTNINEKICLNAKVCTQNKILALKVQNLKQQNSSVLAHLILKRWI